MKIDIYFDGACHNKLGESSAMGVGVAVYVEGEVDRTLGRHLYDNGSTVRGTNNIAEWIGCVEAMKYASELKKEIPEARITIYSDSEIITNQFNGHYQIKQQVFKPYFDTAHKFAKEANILRVVWISRDFNTEADLLSKIALHGNNPQSKHYHKYKQLC